MGKRTTPLLVLTALAIGIGLIAALAGRDSSQPARRNAAERAQSDKPPRRRAGVDPATATAVRYALAARNWTAASYRASWRAQLALAGGRYQRELRADRPTATQLAGLRADRSRSVAKLTRALRDPRIDPPGARVVVTLQETTVAAAQTISGPTVNEVRLRRQGGRWEIVGWTVLPGGTSP